MVEHKTDQPEEVSEEDAPEEVEETEEPQEEEPEEPQDEEPQVRQRKTDWRAEYFKEKNANKGKTQEDDDPVRAAIREELEPIRKSYQEQADERELQATLNKYPDAKGMEKTIRKYMASEAYQNVPVDFIARALIADKSSKKAAADQEAAATRTGGHNRRPTSAPKLPDFSSMTDTEFEEWDRKQNR